MEHPSSACFVGPYSVKAALVLLLAMALSTWALQAASALPPQNTDATSGSPVKPDSLTPGAAQLLGRIKPATEPGFSPVPTRFAARSGMYARTDALKGFEAMHQAASRDGVRLVIVSAFRSFKDQKRIWEGKWTGRTRVDGSDLSRTVPDARARALRILAFSAMPGVSRHHWGTDFDLNAVDDAYFQSGAGQKAYAWLAGNAARFGFCQTYSAKGVSRPQGYSEEKWHWSYMPAAAPLLVRYRDTVSYDQITGFLGAETARSLDIFPNYADAINPLCLPAVSQSNEDLRQ